MIMIKYMIVNLQIYKPNWRTEMSNIFVWNYFYIWKWLRLFWFNSIRWETSQKCQKRITAEKQDEVL